MYIALLYLLSGAAAGFFSGLLGIGGGLVVVPLLSIIFEAHGPMAPELVMHMALGTSLASILFTSVSSSRSHSRRGSVLWPFVRAISPAIAVGTLMGSLGSSSISGYGLKAFFVAFLFAVATQMLFDFYPKSRGAMPGKGALAGAGLVIGGVSSLVGLGGGSMSVPYLRWCGADMHKAVGTSSAIAWPIAIAGTFGYVLTGWNAPGLPAYSLGFVSLPAMLGIACTSVFFAPLGAWLAHRLPVGTLRKAFAVFLYVTACRMLWGIVGA